MSFPRSLYTLALLPIATAGALAQSLPTTQPRILSIFREQIKIGHDAAHLETESGWPAAYTAVKSPDYTLALSSMTGPAEVWFMTPRESYTAWGKSLARDEGNADLSSTLTRLWAADAVHLDGASALEAVAVPELSHGVYPDIGRQRFWEITTFRVKPGHESRFADVAKAYKSAATRSAPGLSWRVYMISAGMPGPTYIVFASVQTFGEFDQFMASSEALMRGVTPAEKATMDKFNLESLVSSVTNRYRLDPKMSYVSPETRATDPAFWGKK